MQAAILSCGVVGISAVDTHFVLDVDHKIVEQIFANIEVFRSRYVTHKERQIRLGGWKDVEADEVDLGKGVVDNPFKPSHNIKWEQWGGLIERGRPSSLMFFRLDPKMTKKKLLDLVPSASEIGARLLRSTWLAEGLSCTRMGPGPTK